MGANRVRSHFLLSVFCVDVLGIFARGFAGFSLEGVTEIRLRGEAAFIGDFGQSFVGGKHTLTG